MKLSPEIDVYFDTMSKYVTIQEYAQIKGVTDRTVYRWIKSGDIEVQDINGRLHIKVDYDSDDTIDTNSDNENQMSEIQYLKGNIEYLQNQLSQALQTIDKMQEDRQRSDTIIMQLTKQLEQQTLMLEDMRHRSIWRRIKEVFATEAV
jgi:predicted site-specific integrase-resolvase